MDTSTDSDAGTDSETASDTSCVEVCGPCDPEGTPCCEGASCVDWYAGTPVCELFHPTASYDCPAEAPQSGDACEVPGATCTYSCGEWPAALYANCTCEG